MEADRVFIQFLVSYKIQPDSPKLTKESGCQGYFSCPATPVSNYTPDDVFDASSSVDVVVFVICNAALSSIRRFPLTFYCHNRSSSRNLCDVCDVGVTSKSLNSSRTRPPVAV